MEWRWIPSYENIYQVSNTGEIRSFSTIDSMGRIHPGRIIKQSLNPHNGYFQVGLHKQGSAITKTVHILVASAFLGKRPDGYDINHINGNKTDNRLENLEYCTKSRNTIHAIETGLHKRRGQDHPLAVLTDKQIEEIKVKLNDGRLGKDVAAEYGISRSHVSQIKTGKRRAKK